MQLPLYGEFAKAYSQLSEQEKKLLSPEELKYLKDKEDKAKRTELRDTAAGIRGNINSGVGVLREGRSWLRFLTGQ